MLSTYSGPNTRSHGECESADARRQLPSKKKGKCILMLHQAIQEGLVNGQTRYLPLLLLTNSLGG